MATTLNDALLASGHVIQVSRTVSQGSVSYGGTSAIPTDATVPQSTEGVEVMTLNFSPRVVGSMLKITVLAGCFNPSGAVRIIALFKDSDASAIACSQNYGSSEPCDQSLRHYMTSTSTSQITFRVRAGGSSAGTLSWNDYAGQHLGNTIESSLTVEEIAA